MVSLTLVAPGSPSSPETCSYSQLLTCISRHKHRPYFLSALISEVWSDPASSKLLPPMFSLLLLQKLNLISPDIIGNIYVEAKGKFSLLSQGLLSWLCKKYGMCKQSIKGNK